MPRARTERLNTAIHHRVLEHLSAEPRGRVIDLGAGDGTLSTRLRDHGWEVLAVDRVARDFLPRDIPIDVADLNERLPYADGQFDAAVSTEVVEHLENPWAFLREVHRVVRPGGVAVVSTPNVENVFVRGWFLVTGALFNYMENAYRDVGHITPVFLWNLRRMAEGRFDVESVTYNANWVPKTSVVLPGGSRMLGQCMVVRLRRRPGRHDPAGRRWDHAAIVRADQVGHVTR